MLHSKQRRRAGSLSLCRYAAAVVVCAAFGVAFMGTPAGATPSSQPPMSTPVNCQPLSGGVPCPNPPSQPGGLDHFLCYHAVEDGFGSQVPPPPPVLLQDQFHGPGPAQPVSVAQGGTDNQLCTPVAKTPDSATGPVGPFYPVGNATAHLYCFSDNNYTITPATVMVQNQFGTGSLVVENPTRLCLPSWKNDLNPPIPPPSSGSVPPPSGGWADPSTLNLNHFQCYAVAPSTAGGGSTFSPPPGVDLGDQFGGYPHVQIGNPVELCAPVSKVVVNSAGQPVGPAYDPNSPDGYSGAHLLCFAVTAGGPHTLQVGNQFSSAAGPGVPGPVLPVSVNTNPADQLCLPSFKTVETNPMAPEVPFAVLLPLAGALLVGGLVVVKRRRGVRTA